jgi:high-affinity nickel-transport protein
MTATHVAGTAESVGDRRSLDQRERRTLWSMGAAIALLHLLGFGLLLAWVRGHGELSATTIGFGTGMLAYSLGLRHAFDIDHVAAIDNTTRALMAQGKRPLATGFFFSLGHSSIVFVMSAVLCLGIRAVYGQVEDGGSSLHHYAGLFGTTVSGVFLLLVGVLNGVVLVGILRVLRGLRSGGYDDLELERHLAERGLMNRVLGRFARRVDTSWKLYPLGLLFGLGFDTATEVSLLVLAGTTVSVGLPFWAILSMPLLFAAGMCLLDTADGAFMSVAYGWAFAQPVRKVYYNLTVTGLSVAVALSVGGLEVAQVMSEQLGLSGGVWDLANGVDLNHAGLLVVGAFVAVWAAAWLVWRLGRIEERWTAVPIADDQT